ncbi:MAG: sodium:proton antiporter [Polaromonas sp.]|nr:sodium:proton antiporter [Polaromonas sp.]MDO9113282.1 sodium:proton antiporter [Polaromonas sp.]MDP1889123.1 sodium:proton antiporter [Polaromonas sp.]
MRKLRWLALAALLSILPGWAMAAGFDGSQLSPLWGIPFAGLLLSIAVMPLLLPSFWHHHFGKVSAAWTLAFFLPFAVLFGPALAGTAGGDPATLMTTLAPTLAVISAGAVFMGANTYIGNAPNLMVKAIDEDRGVRLPEFLRLHGLVGRGADPAVHRHDFHLVPVNFLSTH